jgi:predicted GH43/DUF377 family glycosyl hydrolase
MIARRAVVWGLVAVTTVVAQESKFGDWQVADSPVLQPAAAPAWDDFAIATTSVQRLPDKWMMMYEGIALTEDGRQHAFGLAESGDGIKWTKHPKNPVFEPGSTEWELPRAPSLTKWQERRWALYVVERGLSYEQKSVEEPEPPAVRCGLARSEDGVSWEEVTKLDGLRFAPTKWGQPRPGIYGDGNSLHVWWIGADEDDEPALLHAVSRDGIAWSRPNKQAARDIDSRPICCARVYPAGDYYILVYVAHEKGIGGDTRVVTKISQNARTWSAAGPPEFKLGPHWQHTVPSIVFEKNGARLFYSEPRMPDPTRWLGPRDPIQGVNLRTAFCPKK